MVKIVVDGSDGEDCSGDSDEKWRFTDPGVTVLEEELVIGLH